MVHVNGGAPVTSAWVELAELADGTIYWIQNCGSNLVYLLEVDSQVTPDDGDFIFASKILTDWSQRIKPDSTFFYVKSAAGGSRLSISEAI